MVTVEQCLEHGSWHPASGKHAMRNLSILLSKESKYLCSDRRQERLSLQRHQWTGDSNECAQLLIDPLSPELRLGNLTAGDKRLGTSLAIAPVHIAFLGDSVGAQAIAALSAAINIKASLRRVRFVDKSSSFCRLNCHLATIPSSQEGCLSLLDSIDWPSSGRGSQARQNGKLPPADAQKGNSPAARRVLLVGTGMWYNLKPYCNGTGGSLFGNAAGTPCQKTVLGHHVKPEDLSLDHTDPLHTHPRQFWRQYHRHFGMPPWGWYSWGRRLQGTATIAEYESDVASFLDAALPWARNRSVHLIWMESTPQHFGTEARCQEVPASPMEPGPWPVQLEALCRRARGPSNRGDGLRDGRELMATECQGDWRNHMVRPLLRARGVPFVPLAAALSTRSHLHTGGSGDCTHWCEGTEASLFMATALLNTIASVLAGPQARGLTEPLCGGRVAGRGCRMRQGAGMRGSYAEAESENFKSGIGV